MVDAIAAFARDVSGNTLERIAALLEALPPDAVSESRHAVEAVVPQPIVRARLAELIETWERDAPGMPPQSMAWSLRAASAADAQHRATQSLELVWTGPAPANSMFRRIDQALLGAVEAARSTLVVVTFAAYRVAAVRAALEAAAGRGVRIRLILETRDESEGKLSLDALPALGRVLRESVEVYNWPRARRPRDERGEYGALHAKCAVADDDTLLISSANLTGHALALNMELGVLVRGGALPRQVREHFDALISAGVLAPAV